VSRAALTAAIVVLAPAIAHAHPGRPPEPHDLWGAWSAHPAVVLPLALAAWLYARGVRGVWARAGAGHGATHAEVWAFAAGWLALAIALVSPLHALGEALFSAHMAQHELLMAVAAPLLVLGRPLLPFLWALPRRWRARVGRWGRAPVVRRAWTSLTSPLAAFALHAVAVWGWHVPSLYEASISSDGAHALQHASFLVTALLFWWSLLGARGAALERRGGRGAAVLSLFGTMMHTGVLGALITFAGALWYPSYAATVGAWGLTPLEDQELAGLIMWIPASASYLVAALALVARWLRASEERAAWRERELLPRRR
jgi:cytochrome c oxidase assembly factor CtaG